MAQYQIDNVAAPINFQESDIVLLHITKCQESVDVSDGRGTV